MPFQVHPWVGERHQYPKALIEQVKPDIIVCSHDCWLFYWLQQCKEDFPHVKLVGYYTLDGGPIHSSWVRTMMPLDFLATPTEFGKQEIYSRYPENTVLTIPYGIDHKRFHPGRGKEAEKQAADEKAAKIPGTISVADKCIFSFVGNNQGRKNLAALIEGFSRAELPHAHLLVSTHCCAQQVGGWTGMGEYDLLDLVGSMPNPGQITVAVDPQTDDALASMYRISDFFALPSQAEAPGLPLLEAMACGAVPLVTDYAGAAEVGLFNSVQAFKPTMIRGQFNVFRAMVPPTEVANTLRRAYALWSARAESNAGLPRLRKRAIEVASRFSWDGTATIWSRVLQAVLAGDTAVETELTAVRWS